MILVLINFKFFYLGACENCGAIGHDRKNCFERPRKIPAKYSGKIIAADDFISVFFFELFCVMSIYFLEKFKFNIRCKT